MTNFEYCRQIVGDDAPGWVIEALADTMNVRDRLNRDLTRIVVWVYMNRHTLELPEDIRTHLLDIMEGRKTE